MKKASALELAAMGLRVFPVTPNASKPPAVDGWRTKATTDPATIGAWWDANPDYNIGVAAGDGLVVVDADVKNGKPGQRSLDMLDMLGLPDSLRVATPSGGTHVYLRSPQKHRNRVDTIPNYPGIDIRCDGGYVVGPGSTIDGKAYALAGEGKTPIADSPAWFDDTLIAGKAKHTPTSDTPLVELDKPEHVERATHWLVHGAPEAIEGAGGDDTTYRVACRLRDFGVSEATALELLLDHWNEQKASPPWLPDDLKAKVENAFDYATGGWGAHTAAAEFGTIDDIDIGEPPALLAEFLENRKKPDAGDRDANLRFLTYDEMCAMPEPQWLVENVVQRQTAALMFGKSNTFKSFLAIDIGLSVATGRPWHGNAVRQGRVLFVATEGANGVGRLRIPGWYAHHEIDDRHRGNAYLYPKEICIDQKADVDALIKACRAIGPFALIVLDIFGGTMAGTEVEDTTARAWVHSIQRIMRNTGAATLTVAHTGWQDETRARMHTHFWGSFDSRMRVEGDKARMTTCLNVERHKDADSSGGWGFRLEAAEQTLVPVFDDSIAPQKGDGWPESLKTAMRALDDALEEHGVLKVDPDWPSCRVVEIGLWRDLCDRYELSTSDNKETRRKAFQRAREGLAKRNAIEVQENFVWSKFDVGN